MTPTDIDLYVAIGSFVYLVSMVFFWQLGRDRLMIKVNTYMAELEEELASARRESFQAQKLAYELDAKLYILQEQYVQSRQEAAALRSQLDSNEAGKAD